MTTQEFITRNFGVSSTKDRQCSSVFADHDGNMYSYGYHYPLLFTVGGKAFRNVAGYSNSTAKHINWAGGHDAIDVELTGDNQYSWRNSENAAKVPHLLYMRHAYGGVKDAATAKKLDRAILKAIKKDLTAQRDNITETMASKKRQDTQVYKWLQFDLDRVTRSLERLEA